MDFVSINVATLEDHSSLAVQVIPPVESLEPLEQPLPQPEPDPKSSKDAIRASLKASTLDGVFAAIFSNITGGVLLSNFLLELGADSTQIGLLASIPLLANLLQPVGAYLSERVKSRRYYSILIYGISRSLWLLLLLGIGAVCWEKADWQTLIDWTLGLVFVSHFLAALGSASWMSWMAVLVPQRLRGRYFGIRNSAANLTILIAVPLMGFVISTWFTGTLQGYGVVLFLGILIGFVSLGCQFFMVDVNPQVQRSVSVDDARVPSPAESSKQTQSPEKQAQSSKAESSKAESSKQDDRPHFFSFLQDSNFLIFLLYLAAWMFAVNLCAPFFNLYLLDTLDLDISQVTFYNSLSAGANLLMFVLWGRLADRIGNRPLLLGVGVLVAITPLLWLGTGANSLSIWLWFPLLHTLGGGTWAAIDLCNNNLQMGVAPLQSQSTYFGIAAAIAGVSGALGATTGGFLTQCVSSGGILGVFAISGILRLMALLPLIFVHEQRSQPLHQIMRVLFPQVSQPIQ